MADKEAKKRVEEFLKIEKYKQGQEPLHDSPDTSKDDKPPKDWKLKDGHWTPPGWKRGIGGWEEE